MLHAVVDVEIKLWVEDIGRPPYNAF